MLRTPLARTAWSLALVAALPVAAALAACGGGSSPKAVAVDTWVANLCTSAKKLQATTDAAGAPVIALPETAEPAVAKKTWQDALDKVVTADTNFRADFDRLGKPDLASGQAVQDAFHAEFDANDQKVAAAKKGIAALDPNSTTFNDDLSKTAANFLETGSFRTKLAAVQGSQPVADAIDKDPACASTIFSSDDTASNDGGAPSAPPASISATPPRAQSTTGSGAATAGTTNEKWTRALCTATQTWSDDIDTLSSNLDTTRLQDAATAKPVLVKFLTDARDRTTKFKSDVDALGNPDGKDGKAIEQAFSAGAAQAVSVFSDAVKSAQNLNSSDSAQLQKDISNLGQQINDASDALSATFADIDTKYDTSDLTRIAQGTPECAGLF